LNTSRTATVAVAIDQVVAIAAIDVIRAGAGINGVVAFTGKDGVVAAAGLDDVVKFAGAGDCNMTIVDLIALRISGISLVDQIIAFGAFDDTISGIYAILGISAHPKSPLPLGRLPVTHEPANAVPSPLEADASGQAAAAAVFLTEDRMRSGKTPDQRCRVFPGNQQSGATGSF
jgi:hypothetical protein